MRLKTRQVHPCTRLRAQVWHYEDQFYRLMNLKRTSHFTQANLKVITSSPTLTRSLIESQSTRTFALALDYRPEHMTQTQETRLITVKFSSKLGQYVIQGLHSNDPRNRTWLLNQRLDDVRTELSKCRTVQVLQWWDIILPAYLHDNIEYLIANKYHGLPREAQLSRQVFAASP